MNLWRRLPPRTGDLLELPELIAQEEAAGHPVIVEVEPGTLSLSSQRLYATLGCLVRFVHPEED